MNHLYKELEGKKSNLTQQQWKSGLQRQGKSSILLKTCWQENIKNLIKNKILSVSFNQCLSCTTAKRSKSPFLPCQCYTVIKLHIKVKKHYSASLSQNILLIRQTIKLQSEQIIKFIKLSMKAEIEISFHALTYLIYKI